MAHQCFLTEYLHEEVEDEVPLVDELAAGVEGLVHISELSNAHVRQVSEVVREGHQVDVKVLEVDEDRRRISLSMKKVAESPDYTGASSAEEQTAAPRPEKKRKKPLKGGLEW